MVGELTEAELAAVRDHGYVLKMGDAPVAGTIDRSAALDLIRRTEGSGEADVVSLSYGTLIYDEPDAPESNFGSMISSRPVWLAVLDNVRMPVLGRLSRTDPYPTSFLETRWEAVDARTGEFLISSSLLR